MTFKLLTEQHLEFLSLIGGCTGSSESTLVKMPHCWKLHVTVHLWCKKTPVQYRSVVVYTEEDAGRIRKIQILNLLC